jgi:hypothetical protein
VTRDGPALAATTGTGVTLTASIVYFHSL